MSCQQTFPYVPISKFGTKLNRIQTLDPVAASVYSDIDASFDKGELAIRYGPRHRTSQLYMAERCAKNWDGACEFLSRNDDNNSVCNQGRVASALFRTLNPPGSETIGDILVENTAVRRFCDLSSCAISAEPYNPNDPDSAWVKSYGCCGTTQCLPVCMPPDDSDADIVMNKVLDKPQLHMDLLVNMYKNVNKTGTREKYVNTRVGRVFAVFDTYSKIHGRF
jgi:hypothetical protein